MEVQGGEAAGGAEECLCVLARGFMVYLGGVRAFVNFFYDFVSHQKQLGD